MKNSNRRPYFQVGAGCLSSAVYKSHEGGEDWRYRFNVVKTQFETGRLVHWLEPEDVKDLLKLIQVLCAELACDGCMHPEQKRELDWISKSLEAINCYSHERTACQREFQ